MSTFFPLPRQGVRLAAQRSPGHVQRQLRRLLVSEGEGGGRGWGYAGLHESQRGSLGVL